MFGTGWPSNGGGRLVGSLSGLPYALAEAEQNFLVPAQTQALIWGDLVPQMILSAKIPRWWKVTPAQMHWVALHMRYGADAAGRIGARRRRCGREVLETLAAQARAGAHARRSAGLLESGDVKAAVERVTPSELFVLGREMAADGAGDGPVPGRDEAAGRGSARGGQLRGHLARLRHAQADAGQFLPVRNC